jgi:hypothetical protein
MHFCWSSGLFIKDAQSEEGSVLLLRLLLLPATSDAEVLRTVERTDPLVGAGRAPTDHKKHGRQPPVAS